MVKAFHEAGLEVILDVVYNHTAEAGVEGPTLSFRGLDDKIYQRVSPGPGVAGFQDDYWDVTGCGNTVDASHPFALRMILDSLRYWVTEMHVDGFRFDLLSALTRTGRAVDMRSHLLVAIGQDPVLRHVKLIAEPWDASADGYRVGEFPPPWIEWNDQFRDEIRDFWNGRSPGIRGVATRLAGSSDLYADDGRSPYASVNFVTAHDGFTVRDLVSYDHKHNEANGEGNRDGTDNNRSWNHGVEGETDRPADRRAAPPAGGQPDGDAVPLERRTDDHRRATSAAGPSAATTTPTARTTRSPGSTGGPRTRGWTSTRSPSAPCGCAASTRRCASGTSSRAARRSAAAPRTWPGCTPRAGR